MAKNLLRLLICCSLLLQSMVLASGSTMNIRIYVEGGCSFINTSNLIMNFGELSQGNKTITGTAPVFCTNGTQFTVRLSEGLHASGQQRQLAQTNGSGRLPYSLTASPTSGQSTGNIIDILLTATVKETDYQNLPIGAYSDTVVLTVDP